MLVAYGVQKGDGRMRLGTGDQRKGEADGEEKLGLDEFVQVVQACHVRRSVADDEIRSSTFEVRDDLLRRTGLRDVALNLHDAGQRCLRRRTGQIEQMLGSRTERTIGCRSTATILALPSAAGTSALSSQSQPTAGSRQSNRLTSVSARAPATMSLWTRGKGQLARSVQEKVV